METNRRWEELSWEEKREERFRRWLNPDVKFASPEAGNGYRERVSRFIRAVKLEEPDRVPVMLPAGFSPAYFAGYDLKTVMYDYQALKDAWLRFLRDFPEMDIYSGPGFVLPARVLEIIGHRLHRWPGYGLADDNTTFQYLEGEYMKADEYDRLIDDPTDFLLRTFMPREAEAFRSLAKLTHLTPFIGIPVGYLSSFADPEIQASLQKMMAAGEEAVRWMDAVGEVYNIALEAGYPSLGMAGCGPPFDTLADMFRGTTGAIMDMYRQPEKIHEAMERLIPVLVKEAILMADVSSCPILMMPLHKGDRTFMSPEQFETFYWPTFKRVLMSLVEEGLVPMPFAEGDYEPRLEIIREMPRSAVAWYFEHMDMARAKRVLGDTACIVGNVPAGVMCTGSPAEVKESCRRLIETCSAGGGYILAGSASVNEGNPENLHAMMAAAREYGTYKGK